MIVVADQELQRVCSRFELDARFSLTTTEMHVVIVSGDRLIQGRQLGQIDKQIKIVKKLEIQGKKVTVPEALKKNPGATDEPTPDDKAKKKAEREARRKARQEAQSKDQDNPGK